MALQEKRHTTIFLAKMILLFILPQISIAQNFTDTLELETVNIIANRFKIFSTGTKIQQIDSATLAQYKNGNLADLLNNESGIFIKSYGLGSMASSSTRGAGANQTITLWNGFNLNSPMNGMLDLALLPVGFSNTVNVQYGGSGALWGSGAMGGAIHINFAPRFNQGYKAGLNLSGGSFSNFSQQAFAVVSKKKWISSLKIFNQSAQNNFSFYNSYLQGNPLVKQSNAELKSNGVLSENALLLGKSQLNLIFWYQVNDRNIPPTMVQSSASDNQKDESYRASAEWQRKKDDWMFFIRGAYFDERFNYDGLHSRSIALINEAEVKYNRKKHLFNLGFNNSYSFASSANYNGNAVLNKSALFLSYRLNLLKNWVMSSSCRQEFAYGKLVPFTYSLGTEYKAQKWISAKASFSKIYRLPTLNDLFWVPGGNSQLKPEEGYSEDASLIMNFKMSKNLHLLFEPSLFNRNITNQIVWLPANSYWSPQNMVSVWSRGVESVSSVRMERRKMKMSISFLTNYVLSTNQASKSEGDASVGKQMIYTPRYSGHAKLTIEYRGFVFSFLQSYTGYRFTSTDNSQYLKPYTIGNLYLSKNFKMKTMDASLFVRVENLFNEQYQVVSARAMPMRYYQAGISLQLNKINN